MTQKVWIAGLCVVVAALVAGVIAWTFSSTSNASGARPTLSTVSAQGTKVTLPANDVRTKHLHGSRMDDVTLLGTIGGRSIYRVGHSTHPCFGAGDASGAWPLGVISCRIAAPYFPSRAMPLLDFSMVGMDRGDAQMHYIRVEGVAAQGSLPFGWASVA